MAIPLSIQITPNSLQFVKYPDQIFLDLYMQEALILWYHTLQPHPRPTSTRESLHYLRHSHLLGAPKERLQPTQLQTPYQCGPRGPSILHRDLSNILNLDPRPAIRGDRPDSRDGTPPPGDYTVHSQQRLLLLYTMFYLELSLFRLRC